MISWTVFLAVVVRVSSTWAISGSVHREQPAAFRRDVMSFSRQRAASVDSRAPESQTWALSDDAYPLQYTASMFDL